MLSLMGLPSGSVIKNCPANAGGNSRLIFGSERPTAEGNDNPVPYLYLKSQWARKPSHRVTKSWTQSVTEHACTQSLYSMLTEKKTKTVFFIYTSRTVIGT